MEMVAMQHSLKTFKRAEESMVSFWTTTDPLYTKEYSNYMDGKFYAKGDVASNKSAVGLLSDLDK